MLCMLMFCPHAGAHLRLPGSGCQARAGRKIKYLSRHLRLRLERGGDEVSSVRSTHMGRAHLCGRDRSSDPEASSLHAA